jgi:hypothetical protein
MYFTIFLIIIFKIFEFRNNFREDLLNNTNSYDESTDIESDVIIENEKNITETISCETALNLVNRLESYILKETPEVFVEFLKIKNTIISKRLLKKNAIQKSITDYFNKI